MFLLANLLHFGRLLRVLGVDLSAARMLDVAQALEWIDVSSRAEFRHALRTLLVHRREDLARFDEAFDLFWRRRGEESSGRPLLALGERLRMRVTRSGTKQAMLEFGRSDERGQTRDAARRVVGVQTYSAREAWRATDFAKFTTEELARARALMSELNWDLALRRSRRWVVGRERTLDLRQLVRRNMKYGGELIELPRRRRKRKPRPLVLVCDVSGSMERYSRMLLYFIHAVARGRERVEAFVFATRLTRITPHLTGGRIDEVLTHITRAVPDWAGGTRIGDALRAFNVRWGRRLLGHGPVVLLISDGWDRGDVERLRSEIARLQRSCYRLIWLNPLLGAPGYEPLTRGMQAALRYVDDFLPAHNLTSLEALARHLNMLPPGRPGRRPQPAV